VAKRARTGSVKADQPLLDLIPALSPDFHAPWHLREWAELIDRAATGEAVRGLCSLPIRHYKSRTTEAGAVRILGADPSRAIIYLTHSHEKALEVGKRIRDLARETGVGPVWGNDTIAQWKNEAGGGVAIMSASQSRLGYDCAALLIDDPIDEHGAEDPKVRESVDAAIAHYTARCMWRGKPGPVLLVMSRWHPDDPIGRRLMRQARAWEYVHASAIVDEGLPSERAFAPDVWPLAALKQMREEMREKDPTERFWFAQLMNEPRPMGADLFGPATYYDQLPTWSYRKGFGVDMAFTSGDGSDWFARVAARAYGAKLYLLDITRHKIDAHMIESTCKADIAAYGRAPFFSYMSGPEVGMSRVLRERGVPIANMHARYNKLVRAQRTIRRWNDGDILVPSGGLWVPGFLHRIGYFRGHDKASDDDEVDALVSLSDGILGGAVAGGFQTLGTSYKGMS